MYDCSFGEYVGALALAVSAVVGITLLTSDSSVTTWDMDQSTVQVMVDGGWGTGVVVGDGTFILTAKHVAKGKPGELVEVLDVNGNIQEAMVVWTATDADVTMLKIQNPLPAADVECDPVRKGEKVTVVGFPSPGTTIHWAHTSGIIVKALDVGELRGYPGAVLVTDATIYSGNSGGPMFNEAGDVVGIVVAGLVAWDIYGNPIMHGYNLAVPMSYICEIIPGEF